MTYKAQKLLDYLLAHPEEEHTQYEICFNVRDDLDQPLFNWSNDIRNHCPEIWNIIQEINYESKYIVRYEKYCAKIATKEEAIKYSEKLFRSALNKLIRYWDIQEKIRKEFQLDLNDEELVAFNLRDNCIKDCKELHEYSKK